MGKKQVSIAKKKSVETPKKKPKKVRVYREITDFTFVDITIIMCMLFLPVIHNLELYMLLGSGDILHKTIEALMPLCTVGPVLFLICMGIKMGDTNRGYLLVRNGIQFLLIGFFVNICRYVIPGIVPVFFLHTVDFIEMINNVLKSDIYYCVGLFFIIYGLLKKIKANDYLILIGSLIVWVVTYILCNDITIYNKTISVFLGNFIYINNNSCFPITSWFIFPIIGIIINKILKKVKDKNRLAFITLVISVLVSIIVYVVAKTLFVDEELIVMMLVPPLNAYKMTVCAFIISISLSLFCFTLPYISSLFINSDKTKQRIRYFSNLIIPFYIIQWAILGTLNYIAPVLDISEDNLFTVFVVSTIIIEIVCIVLTLLIGEKLMVLLFKITNITNIKRKFRKRKERVKVANSEK